MAKSARRYLDRSGRRLTNGVVGLGYKEQDQEPAEKRPDSHDPKDPANRGGEVSFGRLFPTASLTNAIRGSSSKRIRR